MLATANSHPILFKKKKSHWLLYYWKTQSPLTLLSLSFPSVNSQILKFKIQSVSNCHYLIFFFLFILFDECDLVEHGAVVMSGGEERWCVVTGGRGFAARHLVEMLIKYNMFSVRIADLGATIELEPHEEQGVLGQALSSGCAQYFPVDLRHKFQVLQGRISFLFLIGQIECKITWDATKKITTIHALLICIFVLPKCHDYTWIFYSQ